MVNARPGDVRAVNCWRKGEDVLKSGIGCGELWNVKVIVRENLVRVARLSVGDDAEMETWIWGWSCCCAD